MYQMRPFLDFAHVQERSNQGRAWLAENYQIAARLLVVCAFFGVIFTTLAVVWINRAAMRRFKVLEDE